jgi:hypothetical protein
MKKPSKLKQTFNFMGEMVKLGIHAFKYGSVTVPPEEKKRRLGICYKCPYYEVDKIKCGLCGCKMEFKAMLDTSKCPLEEPKW